MDRRIKAQIVRQQRKDTPEEIAWRRAHNDALAQLDAERTQRPPVTAETIDQELAWQEARIKELMKAKGF